MVQIKAIEKDDLPNYEALVVGPSSPCTAREKIFIDSPLVRIHLIIEMILVDQPCAMGV